ncbi:MAG TPA: hypothetical protein VD929_05650 [Caulobacteraceae bacterium]|nr:hypothetical protein [Caulobacteraceae bacterium]
MSDRVFFASTILLAAAMILLALVWPQGQGRRSPAPFGKPVETPAYVQAEREEAARAEAAPPLRQGPQP